MVNGGHTVYSGPTPRHPRGGGGRGDSGLSSGSGRTAGARVEGGRLRAQKWSKRDGKLSLGFGDLGALVGAGWEEPVVRDRWPAEGWPVAGPSWGPWPMGEAQPFSGSSDLRGPGPPATSPQLRQGGAPALLVLAGAPAPAPPLALDLGDGEAQVGVTDPDSSGLGLGGGAWLCDPDIPSF